VSYDPVRGARGQLTRISEIPYGRHPHKPVNTAFRRGEFAQHSLQD